VHPGEDGAERGLACAARADHGDPLPGRHVEVHAVQYLGSAVVGVPDTGEPDARVPRGARLPRRGRGGHVDDPDQPGQCRTGRLGLVQQVEHDPDRVEEPQEVQRGRRGGADRDGVGPHQQEPGDEDGSDADQLGPVHREAELALGVGRAHRRVDGDPGVRVDPAEHRRAAAEGAHRGRPADPREERLGALALGPALRRVERPRRAHVPA
jgi:hypothetical protein